MKLPSYKNVFMKVNRKDIYFIYVKLKNRTAELIQRVKVSLVKYVNMFCHDCSYNIRSIFTNKTTYFYNSKQSKYSEHSIEVFKFQLLYRRSFQLELFAREGKKELLNSFIVDSFQKL